MSEFEEELGRTRFSVFLGICLSLGAFPALGRDQQVIPLRFEIVLRKDSAMGQSAIRSMQRVMRKHNFNLSVEEYPSLRGIQEMRRGRVEGTVGRVGDLEKIHGIKGYVRLNAPLM